MTARTRRPAAPPVAALSTALVAALALVAGCTAPAGGSVQSTSAGPPAAAASHTSTSAPSGGSPATGGALTDMTQSSGRPTTTTPSPTAPLPGGGGDIAALAAAGDLTDDGRIDLHGATDSGASSRQDSVELCTFLFGTPRDIAGVTRLAADLTLDPISGRHAAKPSGSDAESSGSGAAGSDTSAAGATVIACVYQADGAPILALQVGDGPPVDPGLPGRPIIVDSGDLHAVLSYSPDHLGPTIDATKARDWLTQALARVAPGSAH